jgi:chemotaxis protein methyltransferase CheR
MKADLPDSEFIALREFIYRRTGLFFTERNRFILEGRVEELVKESGMSARSYIMMLESRKSDPKEVSRLLNKVTITETSFFRDQYQIDAIQRNVIPDLVRANDSPNSRSLRIWSAASSSGEEAYTLAIQLHEHLGEAIGRWNITIYATDINEEVLEACHTGIYHLHALRNTPKSVMEKYFTRTKDGKYRINDIVRKMVTAEKCNLMDPSACRRYSKLDLILLRNVLIYFDPASKEKVLGICHENMKVGGYLFLGHAETGFNIPHRFKLIHFVNAFAYQKKPENPAG